MIEIVIPVLNEETWLRKHAAYYTSLARQASLIFVDGGSEDQTAALARRWGDVFIRYPSRAGQKNFGASQLTGNHLLFLNVDCLIKPDSLPQLDVYLKNHSAGCLTMRIDDPRLIYRVYERVVNLRARWWNVTDADLGLLIRRDVFHELGGFDEMDLMDDIAFSRKLAKHTRFRPLPDIISVSSRRWHEHGFFATFWRYTCAYFTYWGNLSLKKAVYGKST